MKNALILSILIFVPMHKSITQIIKPEFFGHRGCRGLFPENTLEAFQKAIDLGVDGIEWDVVVNSEGKLIISHEPFIDPSYCLDREGNSVRRGSENNIYKMDYSTIQSFDCGSKYYSKFPEQVKLKSHKPTVQEAFDSLDLENISILFEVKSEVKDYGVFQPSPSEYAKIIANEVEKFEYKENIIFMCFDKKLLEALHTLLPDFRYIYLTYKPGGSTKSYLKDLSFKPYALGMYYITIRKSDVKYLHEQGVKVFAWTVNKEKQSEKLKRYQVDGIITDYPDRIN